MENHIGQVGESHHIVQIQPTLDAAAYHVGDVLFETTEIVDAFRLPGDHALLHSVCINDKDDQEAQIDLVFFRTNVALGVRNAAPSITDANADEIIAIVPCSTMYDLTGCRILITDTVGQVLETVAGSKSLWVAGITRGAPVHTATGLTVKVGLASR